MSDFSKPKKPLEMKDQRAIEILRRDYYRITCALCSASISFVLRLMIKLPQQLVDALNQIVENICHKLIFI